MHVSILPSDTLYSFWPYDAKPSQARDGAAQHRKRRRQLETLASDKRTGSNDAPEGIRREWTRAGRVLVDRLVDVADCC